MRTSCLDPCWQRRSVVLLVVLLGALGLTATTAAPIAAQRAMSRPADDTQYGAPPGEVVVGGTVGDGHDARGLRLGLLAFLGLALAGGAVVQVQTIGNARPRRPQPPGDRTQHTTSAADPLPWVAPIRQPSVDREPLTPRPATLRVSSATVPTQAEAECARAITAACRYDRHTTLAAFSAALASDPACKPAAAAGFWEMPPAGHSDLARAYLRHRNRTDARSVVTFALLLFPYDRELTALLREIEG